MKELKHLTTGTTKKDVYKILGQPSRVLNEVKTNKDLLLYIKPSWFGRTKVIKITVVEDVVFSASISIEKPIRLRENTII